MSAQRSLEQFNEIYDETYSDILKYVVCHITNINDVNDVLQETYMELFKILDKKEIEVSSMKAFIKGIAKNKIKKHYTILKRMQTLSLFAKSDNDIELIDTIESDIDLEKMIIDELSYEKVWEYIKGKKIIISQIFFLYYVSDLTIKDIASELNVSESCVKNHLYRTIIELQNKFGKDGI